MKEKTAEKQQKVPGTPFPKGVSGNPNGRPKGQRNYATIYREALTMIAESDGLTPDELENKLHETGLAKALKGDAVFYKDVMDRLHGKPVQTNKNEGEIEHRIYVVTEGEDEQE